VAIGIIEGIIMAEKTKKQIQDELDAAQRRIKNLLRSSRKGKASGGGKWFADPYLSKETGQDGTGGDLSIPGQVESGFTWLQIGLFAGGVIGGGWYLWSKKNGRV
jgi:hypothetical protein